MSKVMFGYPNWFDATATVLSGGSWEASLPLANLQDERLSKVARSTDDSKASTIINVDMADQKYLYVFALPKHNLTINALIRVRLGNDDTFAADNYDTGWVKAYPVIYPADMPLWDDPGVWDGYLAQDDYDRGNTFGWTHVLSAPTNGRYVRIEIDDTANPDTYVDIGRVVLASGYQPVINFEVGAQLGWQTSSKSVESDGGAVFHDERSRRRVFNCVLANQSEDEAMVHLFEIERLLGTSEQFYFIYDIADTVHIARRSFICTMEELSRLVIAYGSYMDQPVSIREEL